MAYALSWGLATLGLGGLGFFTALLISIDVRTHRLPNKLLLWASSWVFGFLSLSSLIAGDLSRLAASWVSAAVAGALMFLLWLCWKFQFGAGDVKLLPVAVFAAVWGSTEHEVASAVATFLMAMMVGLSITAVIAYARRRTEAAASPAILGAAWLTILIHSEAVHQLLNR